MENTNIKLKNQVIRFFVFSIILVLLGSYFTWRKTYESTIGEDVVTTFFRENYISFLATIVGQLPVFLLIFSAVFSKKNPGKDC